MELVQIAAHLNDTHKALVLWAKTIAADSPGEARYQFKSEGGEDIPTLDVLAKALLKHA